MGTGYESFFDSTLFELIILPLLIFLSRILDVSINTVRVIYMLNGKRWLSTALGFFESLIWLIVISQILQNVTHVITYVAYAGGFAAGIYVGMLIEEKLAIGNVIIRIITQKDAEKLIENLRNANFRMTVVEAEGNKGPVNIIFLIVKRQLLKKVTSIVETTNPMAIFTVEGVKSVTEVTEILPVAKTSGMSFFRGILRK